MATTNPVVGWPPISCSPRQCAGAVVFYHTTVPSTGTVPTPKGLSHECLSLHIQLAVWIPGSPARDPEQRPDPIPPSPCTAASGSHPGGDRRRRRQLPGPGGQGEGPCCSSQHPGHPCRPPRP